MGNPKVEEKVICNNPGCNTILSIYNLYKLCVVCRKKAIDKRASDEIYVFLKDNERVADKPKEGARNFHPTRYTIHVPKRRQGAR